MPFMEALKVRVENGKIIGDAPRNIAEGTELELCLVDPDDDMSAKELAQYEAMSTVAVQLVRAHREPTPLR